MRRHLCLYLNKEMEDSPVERRTMELSYAERKSDGQRTNSSPRQSTDEEASNGLAKLGNRGVLKSS